MDLNIDHRQTFNAVITALRPIPESNSCSLITFETPSSTEWQLQEQNTAFIPNFYYEILTPDLKAKQNALNAYTSEVRSYPHPRSTRALEIIARRWGTHIGTNLAEAFRIIRVVSKNK